MATETANPKTLAAWLTNAAGNMGHAAIRLERMWGYLAEWMDVGVAEHLVLLDRADDYRRSDLGDELTKRSIAELSIPRVLQFDPATGGFAEEFELLTLNVANAVKALDEARPLVAGTLRMLSVPDPMRYGWRMNTTIGEASSLVRVMLLTLAPRLESPLEEKEVAGLQDILLDDYKTIRKISLEVNKFAIELANEPTTNAKVKLKDVQKWLKDMAGRGEPYTSEKELALRLRCGARTIGNAIKRDKKLKAWCAKTATSKAPPKAVPLNELVTDTVPQSVEQSPADRLSKDAVDVILAKLIDQAETPEQRAALNSLDTEGQRRLAETVNEHDRDREPSPLDDDDPDKRPVRVRHHKRV